MQFTSDSVPNLKTPAPIVSNLIDHLPDSERAVLDRATNRMYGDIRSGRDGWVVIEMRDYWGRQHVLFKHDAGRLHYQCDCVTYQRQAPAPCAHVVLAAIMAIQDRVMDKRGILTAVAADFPAKKLKPLTPQRPVSAISDEGAIQLLIRDGHPVSQQPKALPWQPHFQRLRIAGLNHLDSGPSWPPGREILYVIDASETLQGRGLTLDTMFRERKKNGEWRMPQPLPASPSTIDTLPEEVDRDLMFRLVGSKAVRPHSYYGNPDEAAASRRTLSDAHVVALLPLLCQTGRCLLRHPREKHPSPQPLQWDDGDPWQLQLDVVRDEPGQRYVIGAHLQRGDGDDRQRMALADPIMLAAGGHVFLRDRVARLNDFGAFAWIALLRERGQFRVPFNAAAELFIELYRVPSLPKLNVPEELAVEEVVVPMRPRLKLAKAKAPSWYVRDVSKLRATLSFEYDGEVVEAEAPLALGILQKDQRRLIRRDHSAEAAAIARLSALGFKQDQNFDGNLHLLTSRLPDVVRQLTIEQWFVEAEGKLYRQPGELKIEVTSGIDWFDLTAKVDFDGRSAALPALLAALRKGETVVRLDDGSFGMLPEAWLKKYGGLAEVGTVEGDSVRFSRAQVGLLDALLASQPQATFDETFRRVRDELRAFDGIVPLDPPATFEGELRPYQCDGLGWFDFLRRFGFGGCLADDMGLGKTVQVLALLEARRTEATAPDGNGDGKGVRARRPALVVVPRSLVFNWKLEATRFAPGLRVLDHSHPTRSKEVLDSIGDYDLIVTTYGTLRRDVAYLKDVEFDYLILDEAQAVKNPSSESAKAVRLLRGAHRLALSGTPVQNHLGDLWSLFEFLNPGMLGSVAAFNGVGSILRTPDQETRTALSRGLRPFILRRTKEQVAKDLPAKLEQTLYCELEPAQRKFYDELRDHYRATLLAKVAAEGMNKAKIQILEALLRLRQAACHPGLIDKTRDKDCSAKLDVLMPRLTEAHAEGHKVLVFSQFTSFLSLLKKRIDAEGIVYEYLDGKTLDRQERVDRFQTDPDCKLFLISLKAGGVGLNLTAADYVFLLDPWWNPAVEAQAIDRTHRIGQTKQVFACRLIARETVEEKVLALQQTKRDLADAIINADNSLIRTLGREDLEMLLS